MNSLERVTAVLQGKKPDILPVGPFVSNHAAYLCGIPLSKFYTNGKVMGETLYKAWEEYGYDIIFAQSDAYYIAEGMGLESMITDNNQLPVIKKQAITSLMDADKLRVPDPLKDGRMPVYLEAIDYLSSKIGDQVMIRGTGTGSFSLLSHLYSIGSLLMDIAEIQAGEEDDEDEDIKSLLKGYNECMDICLEAVIRFTTAEVEAGAKLVHYGDSLASINVISPHIFRNYVYPYIKKYYEAMKPVLKKNNAFSVIHCCGNNTAVLDEYASSGADIYELDYAVDLKYAKERIGSNICILGNIDPAAMVQESETALQMLYEEAVNTGAPGGGFILGSGCEVGMYTPPKNIKAMVEVGHRYKY